MFLVDFQQVNVHFYVTMSPKPEFSCLKSTIKTPAKLTTNTPERRHSVVNDVLLSLLSFLNRFHTLFWFFYYLLWTSKCRLGNNVKFLFQTFFHFMEIANGWINVSIIGIFCASWLQSLHKMELYDLLILIHASCNRKLEVLVGWVG